MPHLNTIIKLARILVKYFLVCLHMAAGRTPFGFVQSPIQVVPFVQIGVGNWFRPDMQCERGARARSQP